jgi:alanyl-tRNA synthetase
MDDEQGYLSDPYTMEFESVVREIVSLEGVGTGLYLERTFFYPESGGQPADRGTLNGKRVIDVQERDEGVLHIVEGPHGKGEGAFGKGDRVEGRIDRERRFDHMQQHSGQHLLSRVFLDDFGLATIGFHLGERACTIDLDGEEVTAGQAEQVERKVNDAIFGNIPIADRTVSRDEYEKISGGGVRSRLPDDVEEIRIVEIEGIDRSTCCGTHVRSTGEIGIVKILKVDRAKGGPRVEFVCGGRALADYTAKHAALSSLAGLFSTDWRELERVVGKLMDEGRSQRKRLSELESELARQSAEELSEPTASAGGYGIVKRLFETGEASQLRETVTGIREKGGMIVLFGLGGEKPALIFACSKGVPLDMGGILKSAAQLIGARGGGGKDFAQGGGGDGSRIEEALDEAERLIKEKLA